jgi:long-chain fatty acid transport protein
MRASAKWLAIAAAAALIAPHAAQGAGYAIYEQGASVLGRAGAGTVSVNDASAMFFNPAALGKLTGTHLLVGGNMLSPVTSFAGQAPYPGYGVTEEMTHQNFFPPTIYLTHRYNNQWAVGAGLNSPFGLGIEWKNPDTFTGNYIVTKGNLRTYNASLSAAYVVNEQWSVSLGGNAAFTNVELDRRIYQPIPGGGGAQADVAKVNLKGDMTPGYGWNAAVLYSPPGTLHFGARYQSQVIVHEDGKADFTQIPTGNAAFDAGVAAALPPDQPVSTVLRMPATFSVGAAWMPRPEWTIEADYNAVMWSVFTDLPLNFKTTPSASETIVENYKDSWQIRLGAEHRLKDFAYRLGWYFDKAAAPVESVTPLLPDADRNGPSIGFGMPLGDGKWQLDAYELALFVSDRNTEGVNRDGFNGTYKSFVNLAGLSLQYHF